MNSSLITILLTVLLLLVSNVLMTIAWYGHLKLQQMGITTGWPLILIIIASWGVAFFEYIFMVPANRLGYVGNGGPFSLLHLKVMQECITLVVFTVMVTLFFKNEHLQWNHWVAFALLIAAVFFAFLNVEK